MAVGFSNTNKPLNPRGNDASPKGYNRAALYSGKALDFDGVNDSIDISNFSLNGYTAFSICFHKVSDFNNAMIFSSADSISDGVNIYQVSPGYFRARLNGYNIDTDLGVSTKDGFFVLTYDGTNLNWYYEAQNIGSGTTSQTFAITNTTSTIGRQSYAAAQYLNGQIAGFKIFNTALTAAQVADLYNNPEKIVPTGVSNDALKLWLPMMEGAGTTAYDGSGNGNHGTISGATWTHGIGSPVAQTAVIDWNKGTNILGSTNIFDAYWTKSGGTLTTGIEAPDGTNTAFKFERDDASSGTIYNVAPSGLSSTNYRYVYAKLPSGTGSAQLLSHNTNTNNTFTITDEWQRFELNSAPNTAPTNFYIVDFRAGVGVDEIHLWAPQAAAGTDESVFVPTIGTAQSSEVLLPQGLTSGRDITGVNLFENVRKQGALNLDGNSWAEVHDNASLDLTSALTMEAWVYWDLNGASAGGIMGKWFPSNLGFLFFTNAATLTFYISNVYPVTASVSHTFTANGWYHLVGTDDGTTIRLYIDGVEVGSTSSLGSIVDTGRELEIGRYNDSINNTYQDSIAQPRIYNRALTAEEVLQNYNSGKSIYQ